MRRNLIALALFAGFVSPGCSHPVRPIAPASTPTTPTPVASAPSSATAMAPAVAAASATAASDAEATAGGNQLSADVRAAFIAETAKAYGLAPDEIGAWLDQARFQQSIINAITRPAEAKPWKDYRPIFLNPTRIQKGRAFFAEHRDELLKVQAETGVPAEIIVAIIGVETSYGGNTGSYRVLDALYTLGFFYPKREAFFRSELGNLFALAREEHLDLASLKGSYAGAMGWGQFMPSSYRNYAKDGDGDGRRDLFTSPRDVFASIANYFVGYGWRRDQPVFVPALADAGAAPFVPENFEASYTLAQLAQRGYRPADAGAPDLPATLLTLEGADGPEYWIGYGNFYVLTRYNRSPLYAMAVFQLSREIAAGDGTAVP